MSNDQRQPFDMSDPEDVREAIILLTGVTVRLTGAFAALTTGQATEADARMDDALKMQGELLARLSNA